jgi:hypothetical protein
MQPYKKVKFWIVIALVVLLIAYSLYRKHELEREGVITIARVDKFESAEQGGDLYITIFFKNQEYKTIVDGICNSCNGNFYYIKIFPDKPTESPRFYQQKPVPDCILSKQDTYNGWEKIPTDTCDKN